MLEESVCKAETATLSKLSAVLFRQVQVLVPNIVFLSTMCGWVKEVVHLKIKSSVTFFFSV